jgi:hypothetical protein
MTDDLVEQLHNVRCEGLEELCWEAGDRIEKLEAALPEQIEWVKRLADDLNAAEGREARLKAKLAKAREAALRDAIDMAWLCFHRCQEEEYVVSVSDIECLMEAKTDE